jgi:LacI family transcriptional regulator
MISLRELARIAGVSHTTVERAFQPNSEIAAQTRQRILALAQEHDYAPLVRIQPKAAALTRVIGCILHDLESTGGNRLLQELEAACEQHAFGWQVHFARARLLTTVHHLHAYEAASVAGILCHPGHYEPLPAELIRRFHARGVPFVTFDVTTAECPVDWVGTDEEALGEMAVDYLYGLGHRRIAYVAHLSKGPVAGRPQAVHQALMQRGLNTDLCIDIDFKDAYHALMHVLNTADRPTAIIGESDLVAVKALSAAQHLGIKVPFHLSILGIGDYPYSAYCTPPLTTIAQPHEEVARRTIDLLFTRLADPTQLRLNQVERIALQPTLVMRASCAKVSS